MGYLELSKQELEKEYGNLAKRFEEIKGMGLNLNMARGKPSKEQLDFPYLCSIQSTANPILSVRIRWIAATTDFSTVLQSAESFLRIFSV